MGALAWEDAWQQALYGAKGFYRAPEGPAGHFATATHGDVGVLLAGAIARLARERHLTRVVDVGAGRGELLRLLGEADESLRLTGVDVVARPDGLPPTVEWLVSRGGARLPAALTRLDRALVLAHEWLDVVPCPIGEVDDEHVLRHRLVDPRTGEESWGPPVAGADLAWAGQHWFTTTPGDRVEIGLSRDLAWAGLLGRIRTGLAVAVDYGHRGGERPSAGTLTGYRAGRQVPPLPDGSCDLTAHVAMDTLDHDDLIDQRTALRGLGVDGAPPPHSMAAQDPQGYLRALATASSAAALTSAAGFGGYLWAIRRVG